MRDEFSKFGLDVDELVASPVEMKLQAIEKAFDSLESATEKSQFAKLIGGSKTGQQLLGVLGQREEKRVDPVRRHRAEKDADMGENWDKVIKSIGFDDGFWKGIVQNITRADWALKKFTTGVDEAAKAQKKWGAEKVKTEARVKIEKETAAIERQTKATDELIKKIRESSETPEMKLDRQIKEGGLNEAQAQKVRDQQELANEWKKLAALEEVTKELEKQDILFQRRKELGEGKAAEAILAAEGLGDPANIQALKNRQMGLKDAQDAAQIAEAAKTPMQKMLEEAKRIMELQGRGKFGDKDFAGAVRGFRDKMGAFSEDRLAPLVMKGSSEAYNLIAQNERRQENEKEAAIDDLPDAIKKLAEAIELLKPQVANIV